MKILHVITGLTTGGAEMMLYKLLKETNNDIEHEVISLSPEYGYLKADIESLGIPVHVLGVNLRSPINPIHSIIKLSKLVKSAKPGVIQGWMYHGNIFASIAGAFCKAPVVWNVRCTLYNIKQEKRLTQMFIRFSKWLSKKPAAIIYNSSISKMQHEQLGFSADNGVLIGNGFDTNKFSPNAEKRMAMRNSLGLTESDIVIGHVARFHAMKDHKTLIKAAIEVLKKHPSIYFVLVGTDVDFNNPLFSEMLNTNELRQRFKLLGEQKDVSEIIPLFDLFTLTSSYGEGFPNVIGEAMACAKPCVSTDVGDAKPLIDETGLIVQPGNYHALAAALNQLLDKSIEERQQLGSKARQRIENYYTMPIIAKAYKSLYSSFAR